MNELFCEEQHMTVREVAEALGIDDSTIRHHIRKLYPTLMKNGKTTYLNEKQVTAIKNLIGSGRNDLVNVSQVGNVVTSLETAESIAKQCGYHIGSVRNIIAALGYTQNGVKTVLTAEQAENVKRRILSNMHKGTPGNTDLHKAYEGDPLIRLASLYAQIDEIKSVRIKELETENEKQQERLAVAEPKAEILDKITATASDVSVRELAAILAIPHLGQNNLFVRLRTDGYIDDLNRPYRQYVEQGIMYEKEYYVPQLDGTKLQLRITQKGVAYFADLYSYLERH
jgi:phage antirepressor YoqD-like protein